MKNTEKNHTPRMWYKAKLRRSILHTVQGNFDLSSKGFRELIVGNPDHRHITYASYWLRQNRLIKGNETAFRDCGQKAIARVAEIMGQPAAADEIRALTAAGPHGYTATELENTAQLHGLDCNPVSARTALDSLPVPFIAHYNSKHYVTVEEVAADQVRLYDSRVGNTTTIPRQSFELEWSGYSLLFHDAPKVAGIHKVVDSDALTGGCCGHPVPVAGLGDDDDGSGCGDEKNCGTPGWSINRATMNFKVTDTPMWWNAPVGPDVYLTLKFNSLDALTNTTPFGDKWSFEYESYMLITPGNQIQVRDGDGRMETFIVPAITTKGPYVTYLSPPGDQRVLKEYLNGSVTLTHPDGTVYLYDVPPAMAGNSAVPLLLSITDRFGNGITITHNANGSITSLFHSALPGKTWDFTYTAIIPPGGLPPIYRVSSVEDPFGRTATFGYNGYGQLIAQTDMGGLAYGYDYTEKFSKTYELTPSYATHSGGYMSGSLQTRAAGMEVFISKITLPRGDINILTEPSDGNSSIPISPTQSAMGYSSSYPPLGGVMWDNYRIRITDGENFTEEFHFDATANTRSYHRTHEQLAVPAGQSVHPQNTGHVRYNLTLTGGKGKISGVFVNNVKIRGKLYNNATTATSQTTDPANNATNYTLSAKGLPISIRPPKSANNAASKFSTEITYEPNGFDLKNIRRNVGSAASPPRIDVLKLTYHPGSRDVMDVSVANSLVSTTPTYMTSRYTWTPQGLPATVTDLTASPQSTTTFTYYPANHAIHPLRLEKVSIRQGSGAENVLIQYAYDDIGRVLSSLDAEGNLTVVSYDGLDRITRVESPGVFFSETIWDCCSVAEERSGKINGTADVVQQATRHFYDKRGLLVRTMDANGSTVHFTYDGSRRLTHLIDAKGNTTQWTFDAFGRTDRKIYPDATYEQTTWLNFDTPQTFRNRRGQIVTVQFDSHGLMTRMFQSVPGSPNTVISGAGVDTTNTYEQFDRLEIAHSTVYPPRGYLFKYDPLGRPTARENAPGHPASHAVHESEILKWTYNDAARTVTRTQGTHSANLRIISETWSSDFLGRLTTATNPLGTFTNAYAGATGQLLTTTHSGGFSTAYTYHGDAMHRALATIAHTRPGGTQIAKHTYGYDPLGRISTWKREATLANPAGATKSYEWEMGYDYASQLTRVIEKTLTGTVAGVHAFGYDPAGNMTTMQKSGGTPNVVNVTTRAHNPLNQVTGLSGGGATLVRGVLNEPGSASIAKAGQPLVPARMTAGNTFEKELNLSTGQNTIAVRAEDATGNVSNYTFRTDIAPVAARNFTYDADGNMTSDGILTYEWDCLNRLIRVNRGGAKFTRFYYNALGQRVVIGEVDGTTFTDLRFLSWDGIQLLSLRKGPASSGYAGAKYERRYYPQGEQSLTQDGSGNLTVTATHHYTRDHLGSVREVVKTDGTLQARYDYDPYGKRIPQYESTAYGSCPFGFTGHYTQKSPIVGQGELVLTHFRAYDPELGRWLSADPLGEAAGINLYGYGPNNPLNGIDPTGGVWHHLIPFTGGLDAGLSPQFINAASNGYDISNKHHKALHAAGWTKEWNDFFKGGNVNCRTASKQLDKMMKTPKYKNILKKGTQAVDDYPNATSRLRKYYKSRMYQPGVARAAAALSVVGVLGVNTVRADFLNAAEDYVIGGGGFKLLTNNLTPMMFNGLRHSLLLEPLWVRRLEGFDQKKMPSDPSDRMAARLFVSCLNSPGTRKIYGQPWRYLEKGQMALRL